MVGEELMGAAVGLLGDRLDLLVADLAERLRGPEVLARHLVRADVGAHRVVVDHRARDRGDALQVVGCARGDPPEGDLLGDAAGEEDLHVVDQLLAGLEVAIFLRQVERVSKRLTARHDRNLLHLVDGGEELGRDRVPGFMPGDDLLLVSR